MNNAGRTSTWLPAISDKRRQWIRKRTPRPDTNNVSPRLGPTSDHKTVLRTGAGVSFVEAYNAGKQLHQDPPLTISQLLTTDLTAAPPFTIAAGLPLPAEPDLRHSESYRGNVIALDQHLRDAKARSVQRIEVSFCCSRRMPRTAIVYEFSLTVRDVTIRAPSRRARACRLARPQAASVTGKETLRYQDTCNVRFMSGSPPMDAVR